MTETVLDRRIGTAALVVAIGGVDLDPTLVGPVTIRHGRDDPAEQPDASTCSVTIEATAAALPSIGDTLTVDLGADALDHFDAPLSAVRRFAGTVTDLQAIPARGVTGYAFVRIVAASPLARLGRITVGDVPWPDELDGVRADRILDLVLTADPAIVVDDVDPGFYNVRARDVDRKEALGLLRELAADTLGLLVGLRDGSIAYRDAEHRQGLASRVTLDASNALASTTWTSDLGGLVNDLTVAYGSAEPQAEVRIDDGPSIATFGPFAARVATQLDDADAATAYAVAVLGRYSRPAWRIDGLRVDLLRSVPTNVAAILLDLEVSDLLTVTGFPSTGPFVTSRLWVEGWAEEITRSGWRLDVNVSGYRQGGASARWLDVDPAVTWDSVPDGVSWLGSGSWEFPEANLGRWADAPSDLEWIDAPDTWAAWPA